MGVNKALFMKCLASYAAQSFSRDTKIGCDHVQRNTIEYVRKPGYKMLIFFFGAVADRIYYPMLNSIVTPC